MARTGVAVPTRIGSPWRRLGSDTICESSGVEDIRVSSQIDAAMSTKGTPHLETSISLLDRLAGSPSERDWQRMVELYQPLLRSWCLRSGVPEADVDDLTQETLMVILREVATFDRRHP